MADTTELKKMLASIANVTDGAEFILINYVDDETIYRKPTWQVQEMIAVAIRGMGRKAKFIQSISNGSEILYKAS